MSVCNNCYNAGPIDSCSTGFAINLPEANDNFHMYVQNNATKGIQVYDLEYLISGEYQVLGVKIDPMMGYNIWFAYGQLNDTHITFTKDEIEYECLNITVVNSNSEPIISNIL